MTTTRTHRPGHRRAAPAPRPRHHAATAPRSVSAHHRDLLRRAASPDHHRWLAHTATTRGCVRPVRLTGQLHTVETATGRILDTRHTTTAMPDGVLYVPCGDRRASVCPPCAETYRADTYQLIRAGLAGGKGVPDLRRHPPGRVRHPHRALLRARPHPAREPPDREGRAPAACAATSAAAPTARA